RCHLSTLAPGAGYDPHCDPYDVAMILLDGELESLDQRLTPHSVIFYPAGQPHGLKNPGAIPARYLVFEFHGSDRALDSSQSALSRWISSKLVNRHYWRKRFETVARSVRKRMPG